MLEVPQSFVVRQECEKAAWQNGFRRVLGEESGWVAFGSTTAQGTIYLAATGSKGPWFLALDHGGVIDELGLSAIAMPGPGGARFAFDSLGLLYAAVHRIYQLATSLPDVLLQKFQSKVKNLPQNTEAEQLVVQRVGQDIFRAGLMDYWQTRCPLTGITDPELLRASHIIPWKDCATESERLDVYNGLLLSALWDAAFDRGLVTFDDEGKPEFSSTLSKTARIELRWHDSIPLTDKHRTRLRLHRASYFKRL